jgi:exopolyphosphatase/guanosine-5'-triphosphate,3'-diphosphate pyrophosphatase
VIRAAAIDIGTNTFRLLIADVPPGELIPVRRERMITRLGEGFHSGGRLSPADCRQL